MSKNKKLNYPVITNVWSYLLTKEEQEKHKKEIESIEEKISLMKVPSIVQEKNLINILDIDQHDY